ncbi:MAG: DNA polymerase III subunit beta [Pseudomonadota bacterium]
MQFSLPKALLIGPLQLVCGVADKRGSSPIMSHLLVSVSEGQLVLTGTDSEIELVVNINLTGEHTPGETTVPAKKLLDLVKSFRDEEELRLVFDNDKVQILAGKSKFSLVTQPAADFPSIDDMDTHLSLKVEQSKFRHLISYTQFAMAQQDVRYYLNGMLMTVEGETARLVATDGHRLALCEVECVSDINNSEKVAVIIPRKAIIEVSRLFVSEEETCSVFVDNNHIRFQTEHFCFTSKLVDGRFPDYDRVIPKNSTYCLAMDKVEFKDALIRASVLCNEKFKGVRLLFEPGQLTVLANNPEQEEAQIELPINFDGDAIEIGFNVTYLLDVLNAINSEQVRLSFTDANTSTLMEEVDGSSAKYVVMPMRL